MKNTQKIRNRQMNTLAIDFQESKFCTMSRAFSDAYFPACKAIVSLVNLPMIKVGIIYLAFNFDIPAAKNSGVVGSGNRE